MADTLTVNTLLTNQTEGGNSNSWGTIADANFEEIDDKFGDVTSISTTGGTTTLTASQEIVNAIALTGTLVSNVEVVFSARGGTWVIKNGTSGAFSVTCKVSGQTGTEITQGTRQQVYSTGTDIESAGGSSNATSIPTGFLAPYLVTTAPTGWVRANGRTIGNASSGSAERANADTSALFVLLWSGFDNTHLPILDSAGTLTSRGASGAADFAANKRMPLPSLRGRTLVGLDDMGNSAASIITAATTFTLGNATTNGSTFGTQTHTLITAELAAHTHTGPSHTHTFSATSGVESAGHTHGVSGSTGVESADHTHGYTQFGTTSPNDLGTSGGTPRGSTTQQTGGRSATHTHSFSTTSDGVSANHTHSVSGTTGAEGTGATGSTGSGTAHANTQPSYLTTIIIKL